MPLDSKLNYFGMSSPQYFPQLKRTDNIDGMAINLKLSTLRALILIKCSELLFNADFTQLWLYIIKRSAESCRWAQEVFYLGLWMRFYLKSEQVLTR